MWSQSKTEVNADRKDNDYIYIWIHDACTLTTKTKNFIKFLTRKSQLHADT